MLAAHLKALNDALGLSAMSQLNAARDKLRAARLALSTLRSAALTPDLLPGTGGDEWREMWDATEAFAAVAYPGSAFPFIEDGAKCPFCQQDIHSDVASRLQHFAEFVTSTAQEEVRQAETEYSALRKAATSVQVHRPEIDGVVAEVVVDDATLESRIAQYLATANEMRQRVASLSAAGEEPIIATTFEPQLEATIRAWLPVYVHARNNCRRL